MKRKATSGPVHIGAVIKQVMERMEAKARAAGFQSSDAGAAVASKAVDLIKASGAPKRQLGAGPAMSGKEWHDKLEDMASKLGTGFLVAFIGGRGPGKTQMGVELIKLAAMSGMAAKYSTAMEFFIAVKGAYRDDAGTPSEQIVIEQFTKPRLLVLDEIQERGATPWEDRLLTHLVDVRYRELRDTVLIGNLANGAELAAQIGPSIASRLTETGGVIEFKWPSFRAVAKPRGKK